MIPSLGIGWGLLVVSMAGLVCSLLTPKRKLFFVVYIFILLFYLFLSSTYGATHNWHIPLIPFLILFASFFIYFVYIFFIKHLTQSVSLVIIGLFLISISIIPLKNIYQFKMNITENMETERLLKIKLEHVSQNECVFIRDEKIKSIADLNSSKKYIVFTNDWFAIESHPYPNFLLHYENFQKRTYDTDWLLIRKYVEKNWKVNSVIEPKYSTLWTNNPSVNVSYIIYEMVE